MKSTNTTTTEILLKSLDVELKKLLQQDLQAYRTAKIKNNGTLQTVKQAA
jgi:hypothetical protein